MSLMIRVEYSLHQEGNQESPIKNLKNKIKKKKKTDQSDEGNLKCKEWNLPEMSEIGEWVSLQWVG